MQEKATVFLFSIRNHNFPTPLDTSLSFQDILVCMCRRMRVCRGKGSRLQPRISAEQLKVGSFSGKASCTVTHWPPGHWFVLLVLELVASPSCSVLFVKVSFKNSVLGAVRKPSDLVTVRSFGIKFQFSLLMFGHTLGK